MCFLLQNKILTRCVLVNVNCRRCRYFETVQVTRIVKIPSRQEGQAKMKDLEKSWKAFEGLFAIRLVVRLVAIICLQGVRCSKYLFWRVFFFRRDLCFSCVFSGAAVV